MAKRPLGRVLLFEDEKIALDSHGPRCGAQVRGVTALSVTTWKLMTSERRWVGERIGIVDAAFGIVIGIMSWFSIMSDIPARWPWGLIAVLAAVPAALFAAMFAVCCFIIRAL